MKRNLLLAISIGLMAVVFHLETNLHGAGITAALAGKVTSAEEGPMEGVLVNAKKLASTISISVVSDKSGQFSFPNNKLEPGQYALSIRAVGYDLDGPKTVDIASQKTVTTDIKLKKTLDIASQLSSAEWLLSMPGTEDQKKAVMDCSTCHTFERIVKSKHSPDEFIKVMQRMATYAPGSQPMAPQRRVVPPAESQGDGEHFRNQATYLSAASLSKSPRWEYPLKTLPRATGRSTRVIVTEYDLPRRGSQPHDVVLDSEGMAWYGDFGKQFIGKLDPQTGKVTEYPVPEMKKGFPQGMLDLEIDRSGTLWMGMMLQGAIAKFDRKSEKFQIFSLPQGVNSDVAQQAMVMPLSANVDGKVWMNNVGLRGLHRMDIPSGKFETFEPYKDMPPEGGRVHSVYGISADSKNNIYFMDFGDTNIGRIDAKSGKISLFPTPTKYSRPRRGHMDSEDRLWFAEYRANTIAMFDTKTDKYQEWEVPVPWTAPYDVVQDKNGELWTGGMTNDRVIRLNPKTGEFTTYPLPRDTNIRRVFVDNTTTPVTFWVGSDHGASIVKVEPLD